MLAKHQFVMIGGALGVCVSADQAGLVTVYAANLLGVSRRESWLILRRPGSLILQTAARGLPRGPIDVWVHMHNHSVSTLAESAMEVSGKPAHAYVWPPVVSRSVARSLT